jgi:hypothetical protein
MDDNAVMTLPPRDWAIDRRWRLRGELLIAASLVFLVCMQWAADQWLPAPISVSQYGIGRWGWIFSLWAMCCALGPLCLERAVLRPTPLSRVLLTAATVGAFVMAVVRTQAGGAQVTWNAQVHMAGSIVIQAGVPLGLLALLWLLGLRWRIVGMVFVTVISAALVLLLISATGSDTTGLGAERSWALWQSVAVLGCELMGVVAIAGVRRAGSSGTTRGSRSSAGAHPVPVR